MKLVFNEQEYKLLLEVVESTPLKDLGWNFATALHFSKKFTDKVEDYSDEEAQVLAGLFQNPNAGWNLKTSKHFLVKMADAQKEKTTEAVAE